MHGVNLLYIAARIRRRRGVPLPAGAGVSTDAYIAEEGGARTRAKIALEGTNVVDAKIALEG